MLGGGQAFREWYSCRKDENLQMLAQAQWVKKRFAVAEHRIVTR